MTTDRPAGQDDRGAPAAWSSNAGFLLAAVGSAIGLGNIWRFSYLAGENGGAAFLLIYLVAVSLIGLPLLLAEFCIGKAGGADPTRALPRLSGRPLWTAVGWLPAVTCAVSLAYYGVIAGWVARYFALALVGDLAPPPAEGYGAAFDEFRSRAVAPVVWQALIMIATGVIVAAGVNAGIERLCRTVLPILALILIALSLYSLSLPGSGAGLRFLFLPDWGALARPQVYLAALGQALFSLGVGFGVMLIYGAYAGTGQSLPRIAIGTAVADTTFALVAGIAIFGAVFAFGLDPQGGPALAFITLPQVFASMPGGTIVAVAFFGLLLAAALTSAVGFLEVCVAVFLPRTGWPRPAVAALSTVAIFVLGLPTALADGPLREVTIFGVTLLAAYDRLVGEAILPVSALLFALFVGWRWVAPGPEETSELGRRMARPWLWLIRYAIPAVILLLLVAARW